MNNYGTSPAAGEIEVTLFGPGYGEAIAVHLGDGAWFLVDSCIDPSANAPASGVYLDNIGVASEQICTIVASHWHDDHVRGMAQLADKYAQAKFVISAVFNDKEAAAFLSAFNGESSSGLARGVTELFSVVNSRDAIHYALHGTLVIDNIYNGQLVQVTALSPVSAAFSQSIANFASYIPGRNDAINDAPQLRPNAESIVLHINFDGDAILLGADLEEHAEFGWSAVATDSWSGRRQPASLYKVAHHGSARSDCESIWNTLLQQQPKACLTPWILAGRRLPTTQDEQRLKERSGDAYIASVASRRPAMEREQIKRLADLGGKPMLVDSGFGVVRLRKMIGTQSWGVELFGAARKL